MRDEERTFSLLIPHPSSFILHPFHRGQNKSRLATRRSQIDRILINRTRFLHVFISNNRY